MEKVEKNMYIRTKDGIIAKVKIKTEDSFVIVYKSYDFYNINNVTKASYNIIDLIEEGDYVNGQKIDMICKRSTSKPIESVLYHQKENCDYEIILGNNIKSVVTHEQFESVKYQV